MKVNIKKIILFIIIFLFVLTFFKTISHAAGDWVAIATGSSSDMGVAIKHGYVFSMMPYETSQTGEGTTYKYKWSNSGEQYELHTLYDTNGKGSWTLYRLEFGYLYTDDYKTYLQYSDATYLFTKGAKIISLLRNIAAIVSVVVLSIIGVRYMVGSVEQKAEYKQTMVPVVVGCILIGSISAILTVIQAIF